MRLLILLLALPLAGCLPGGPTGRDLTASQASAYFAAHQDRLENLKALVEACRPIDSTRSASVWRDGSGADRCAAGDPSNLARIRAWLENEEFVAVNYWTLDDGAVDSIAGLEVVTYTEGLGVSGTLTSLIYLKEPQPNPVVIERRENGSVLAEERALTPAPFHWFWQHSQ